jgi:hypothetical protein
MATRPRAQTKDNSLPVPVEDGARGRLKGATDLISEDNIILVLAKLVDVVHVPNRGLPEDAHEEAAQTSLQESQQRLDVYSEEHRGRWVTLPDGELHRQVRR